MDMIFKAEWGVFQLMYWAHDLQGANGRIQILNVLWFATWVFFFSSLQVDWPIIHADTNNSMQYYMKTQNTP